MSHVNGLTNGTSHRKSGTPDTTASGPSTGGVKRKRVGEQKFYAVRQGKVPGVYNTWDECLKNVTGHKGAVCG